MIAHNKLYISRCQGSFLSKFELLYMYKNSNMNQEQIEDLRVAKARVRNEIRTYFEGVKPLIIHDGLDGSLESIKRCIAHEESVLCEIGTFVNSPWSMVQKYSTVEKVDILINQYHGGVDEFALPFDELFERIQDVFIDICANKYKQDARIKTFLSLREAIEMSRDLILNALKQQRAETKEMLETLGIVLD